MGDRWIRRQQQQHKSNGGKSVDEKETPECAAGGEMMIDVLETQTLTRLGKQLIGLDDW
jgi:hypothetical protein